MCCRPQGPIPSLSRGVLTFSPFIQHVKRREKRHNIYAELYDLVLLMVQCSRLLTSITSKDARLLNFSLNRDGSYLRFFLSTFLYLVCLQLYPQCSAPGERRTIGGENHVITNITVHPSINLIQSTWSMLFLTER